MKLNKRVGFAVVALLAGGVMTLVAASGDGNEPIATIAPSTSPAGGDAMRVYLDPETGDLQPGANAVDAAFQLDPATENALRFDDEGLVQIRHADGAESVDLQGRYQSATVVHLGKDGKFTFCTDDEQAVQHSMTNEIPNPAVPEVK